MKTTCLGVECTAHTFGVGIAQGKKILANVNDTYKPVQGGIVPTEAAEHHVRVAEALADGALAKAGLSYSDIDMMAFSAGPGLAPCLLTGMRFVKQLAEKYNKPIVPVNHCIAHIEIGKVETGAKDPLVIYVSGGNTQVIGLESGYYRVFGETLDIGLGNAMDKFGRGLGLPSPPGAALEKLALQGKNYIKLPYTVKGMDLTFSGLVTAAEKLKESVPREDIAYSIQETAFSMLTEVTERALAHTKKRSVLIIGGVARSMHLRKMLTEMAKPHHAKVCAPSPDFCSDNGAMIAFTGTLMPAAKSAAETEIRPRWRTDEVEVDWQ